MWSNLIKSNPVSSALNNAWDDDDDIEDDDNESQEDEPDEVLDSEDVGSEEEGQQQEDTTAPQQQPTLQLGKGMFMGRLTRFIEQVTHADDEQEEGWDDDDDNIDLSEDLGFDQANEQLQGVLTEIDSAEQQQQIRREHSQDSLTRDQEHCQQAEREISTELQGLASAQVMVDQTPPVSPRYQQTTTTTDSSIQPSLNVLCEQEDLTRDSGDAGGAGISEEMQVYDDENELEFGPVVDHTPSRHAYDMSRQNSMAVNIRPESLASASNEGWGEDEDDLDVDEDEDVQEEAQPSQPPASSSLMVDHTPTKSHNPNNKKDLSVGVLYDEAEESSNKDMIEPDDDVNDYGPVVDQTPTVVEPVPGGAESLAVQAMALEEDFLQDDAMDETEFGDSVGWSAEDDDEDGLDQIELLEEIESQQQQVKEAALVVNTKIGMMTTVPENHIVNHVPVPPSTANTDPSLAVLCTDEDASRDTGAGNDEDVYDDENEDLYGPIVDTLPTTPAARTSLSQANSVAVYADETELEEAAAMDDTAVGGEGWGEEDDDDIDIETAMGDEASEPPPPDDGSKLEMPALVDHTPSEMGTHSMYATDPSVDVVQSEDGSESDTEFGPVVDHLPTPAQSTVRSDSVVVQATDALSDADEEDDEEEDGWGKDDLAIDEVDDEDASEPPPPEEDDDVKPLPALVDHTPSEIGTASMPITDPSVDVVRSEDGSESDVDDFGPVVDQCPTPAHLTLRSDSVVVQAHDLDTVDETYGGEDTEEEDGGDNIDEMPSALRSFEDQLVDHIPRPESRYGDASTMVAADPSEVLSEVDDMVQEEQNFGPVVDLTPPSHAPAVHIAGTPSGTASLAAGSTSVFAPASVAADDLDGDETASQQEAEEEAPNPQSGNDEAIAEEEVPEEPQVVDFLPPQNERRRVEAPSIDATRGLSEMSVGGAQSLIQNLDQKEDDFGPVVDVTPTVRSATRSSGMSIASTATQITAGECVRLEKQDVCEGIPDESEDNDQKVVVDKLPQIQVPVDSTASVGGSQLAEDEEDDSKFGPVVDHLPTPRASLAPSRGGSTVDALATVSEVNSDVDDGGEEDGWDDDGDIDVSESGVSDGTALKEAAAARAAFRRSDHERNMTVRFHATVDDCRSHDSSTNRVNQTDYFDPEMGTDIALDETRYYDPNSSGSQQDGWGDDDLDIADTPLGKALTSHLPDKSFAEADTPPSTPYRKAQAGDFDDQEPLGLYEAPIANVEQCGACFRAKTTECPCVQRLLKANGDSGALIGFMVTPEGEKVQVDFSKLLQDEITKRRLVEEESKALRSTMEADTSVLKVKDGEMKELLDAKVHLEEALGSAQASLDELRRQNADLVAELRSSQEKLRDLERAGGSWSIRESALEAEVKQLNSSLQESTEALSSDAGLNERVASLQSRLATKTGECEELNAQVMQLQLRVDKTEGESSSHKQEVDSLTSKLDQVSGELDRYTKECRGLVEVRDDLSMKLETLETELALLRETNEELTASLNTSLEQHEAKMKEQYSLLDGKRSDERALEDRLKKSEAEKASLMVELSRQRALAEKAEGLAAELLSVAQEKDLLQEALQESKDAVLSMQKLIDEHGMEQQALDSQRDVEIASLKDDLQKVADEMKYRESEIKALTEEKTGLMQEKDRLCLELEQLKSTCRSAEGRADQARLKFLEEEDKCCKLTRDMDALQQQVSKLTADLQNAEAERRKSMTHLAALGRTLAKTETDSKTRAAKVEELEKALTSAKDEVSRALFDRDAILKERDAALARCQQVEEQTRQIRENAEMRIRDLSEQSRKELSDLRTELERQLEEQRFALTNLAKERDDLYARCHALDTQIARSQQDTENRVRQVSDQYEELVANLQGDTDMLKAKLEETQASLDIAASERDQVMNRFRQMEEKSVQDLRQVNANVEHLTGVNRQMAAEIENGKRQQQNLHDQIQSMSNQLAQVQQQLEAVSNERDTLAEENEEMLVQFGLLQEKMEASEQQVNALEARIASEALPDNNLEERFAQENASLVEEVNSLGQQLEQLAREKAMFESRTESLAAERNDLFNRVRVLESGQAAGQGDGVTEEMLRDEISSLEKQLEQLVQERALFESRAESLTVERNNLFNRIRLLESGQAGGHTDDAQHRELEQRYNHLESISQQQQEAIRELQNQLRTTDEQHGQNERDLRDRVESLRNSITEKDERINELEELYEETQDQLNFAQDQLTASEATLKASQNLSSFEAAIDDLETARASQNVGDIMADYERRMKDLEAELGHKNKLVSKLEESVSELQFQLEAGRSQASFNLSSSGPLLQDAEQDAAIAALQAQIDSLTKDLEVTKSLLSAKDNDVVRLQSELEEIQSKQALTKTTELLDKPADGNDVENLRSHVVSLAIALERSENKRAEAISRLLTERESSAKSLRKLSESVKRFYSSVSHGEPLV